MVIVNTTFCNNIINYYQTICYNIVLIKFTSMFISNDNYKSLEFKIYEIDKVNGFSESI